MKFTFLIDGSGCEKLDVSTPSTEDTISVVELKYATLVSDKHGCIVSTLTDAGWMMETRLGVL